MPADRAIVDLTGQRFGRLEVLSRQGDYRRGSTMWSCRCDCGKQKDVIASSLRSGNTRSCGCLQRSTVEARAKLPIAAMLGRRFGHLEVIGDAGTRNLERRVTCRCACGTVRDFLVQTIRAATPKTSCGCRKGPSKESPVGRRFGRLTVIGPDERNETGSDRWLCRCDCGRERSLRRHSLRIGKTQSCGCLQRERSSAKAGLPIAEMMGKTFGQLEVIGDAGSRKAVRRLMCRCSCGAVRDFSVTTLRHAGPMTSCGCTRAGRRTDLTGKRFGRLVVLGPGDKRGKHLRWQCKCDCGTVKNVQAGNLKRTTSCGCYHSEKVRSERGRAFKHGGAGKDSRYRTPAYVTWQGMIARCTRPKSKGYPDYGGRGIAICDRWRSFEDFLADMGDRPSDEHSLDRIDPNGNYEPGNCRWATRLEQAQTKRTSPRRVAEIADRMIQESTDLLERAAYERMRRAILGC